MDTDSGRELNAVAVVVTFFICWAPFHAQRLVAIYGRSLKAEPPYKLKLYEIITYISGVLYYVSTTVNPLLYHIMSNKFREAFKETLGRCWCGKCRRRRRRNSSSRLSERRSCYSVLSRSGGGGGGVGAAGRSGRPAMQQDSTDSGTSVSTCVQPYATKHASIHNDIHTPDVDAKTQQFSFDMQQVVSLNKLNIQYEKKPESRSVRFLNIFRCIARSSLDDKKLQHQTPSPISECHERQNSIEQPNEQLCISSYEISNSSLRDIENGALEDELTIYMKEIQRREKNKS